MLKESTITFIGSGMMAEAMIAGLLNKKLVQPEQIIAAGPRESRGEKLAGRYGVRWTTNNESAAEEGDLVVLSVKPQVLGTVIPEVRGHLRRQNLVLSIVAGAPLRVLADGMAHASVVRAMPNTPGQIGMGITVWTAAGEVSEVDKAKACAVLGGLGEELYVADENYLDMATALSGTGPAYVFFVHGSDDRRRRPHGLLPAGCQQAGHTDHAGLGYLCPTERPPRGRIAQPGHVAWRHLGRGDLPVGKGGLAYRRLPGHLGRLSAFHHPGQRQTARERAGLAPGRLVAELNAAPHLHWLGKEQDAGHCQHHQKQQPRQQG